MQIYREGYNTYGLSIPHLAIMSCWEIDIPLHQSTAFTITMASVYGGSELDTVLQQGSSCAPPLSSPLSSILTCGLQVDFSAAVCYTIRLRCQKSRSTRWGCNSKHWKTRSSHKCRSKLLFQVETPGLWEVKCYLTIVPL